MAGIYLHIPFCKKACHYCDFHFSTSLKYKKELLEAMHKELEMQQNYLRQEPIETIYFGGGTPSLIGAEAVTKLIDTISQYHKVSPNAEITLEANPDDLDKASVQELNRSGINRFSIGIQSFFEEDLRWMNRAHNATEADSSVKRVQDAGFENITLDLIYGYPLLTDEKWKKNIEKTLELGVPHVSAYSMTVEPRTALAAFINKGKQQIMDDAQSAEQYLMLMEMLKSGGFEHYETSNFAKPGCYSRHNTNYWKGVPYLGIGPSAHSFDTRNRQWNVANNAKYIQEIASGKVPAEIETLSLADRLNEYIMTSLRTMWGLDLQKAEQDFGSELRQQIEESLSEFVDKGYVLLNNNSAVLSTEGKLFADHIASELFISENFGGK